MTGRLARWIGRILHRLRSPRDDVIDELIAGKRAKPRPGMDAVDWRKVNKAGARRWAETLRGQRRLR